MLRGAFTLLIKFSTYQKKNIYIGALDMHIFFL